MGKPTSIWFSDEQIDLLKSKSKKKKRSLGSYIKGRLFEEKKK